MYPKIYVVTAQIEGSFIKPATITTTYIFLVTDAGIKALYINISTIYKYYIDNLLLNNTIQFY